MRKLLFVAVALIGLAPAGLGAEASFSRFCAFCGLYGGDTITSDSGQFVVHGKALPLQRLRNATNNPAIVELNSQLTAVSAERTKRLVTRQLQLPGFYRDKIHIVLINGVEPTHPIRMVTSVYSDGFHYQMAIPVRVENDKLVRGLVQALILEVANRSGRRSAELPAWLIEGMTQEVSSELMPAYVANRRPLTRETLGYDRLHAARNFFSTNTCLTMSELSFYNDGTATPLERTRFEYSAQLMVNELLQLRDGPKLMVNFLQALPSTWNWQTAFHRVYAAHFKTPLALEKWWALTWVDFQNKREKEIWPVEVSLEKMEAVLLTSVEMRMQTNSLPQHRLATLHEVITETSYSAHKELLAQKVQKLFFLSYQLSPMAAAIATEYQECLKSYIDRRAVVEYQPALKSDPAARKEQVVKNTLQTLEALDQMRADLKAGKPVALPGRSPQPQASR